MIAASSFASLEEDSDALAQEQSRIAALRPPLWRPGDHIVAGGVFIAFARGEQGPGQRGDRAVVGAAATRGTTEMIRLVVDGVAGARYRPGYLAAREGNMLETAIRTLVAEVPAVEVLLIDATGRDHPRRAGLALHLGAVLEVPTIGVTHRPLLATGPEPDELAGAWSELTIDGDVVGRWVRTHAGVRPIAVHAAWRTDPDLATEVVLRVTAEARTPEPLRLARMAAREERASRSASD